MLLGLQPQSLDELQRALNREFSTSWSINRLLVVLGFFFVVVLLIWFFSRREAATAEGAQRGDPHKLYRKLLAGLPLSSAQRDWLATVAGDLGLAHPAVLLLSPSLFDHYVQAWQASLAADDAGSEAALGTAARLRSVLFP